LGHRDRLSLSNSYTRNDREIISKSITGIDYRGKGVDQKIIQLFGDSTEFDFTSFHDKVDIVFIDGAHNYPVVLSDTKNALQMVRKGGVIIWHDFGFYHEYNDIVRAVLALIPGEEIIQIESTQLAVHFKQ
jgi:hypothetical protein